MLKLTLFFSFLLSVQASFSQVVEEVIQIDTTREVVKVIYKPIVKEAYYFKKVAVFADDTSQIAIEKSYNKFGQNGLYKVYYPSGRLKIKTVFANNKINGEWTYYGLNGIIITKGIYKENVKNGYWAYKSLKIYGRYKKGLKNKKWKRYDENEKKYLSHYNNGILTGGEGYDGDEKIDGEPVKRNIFSSLFPKKRKKTELVVEEADTVDGLPTQGDHENEVRKEYKQAISFLTTNALFRRTAKSHFGGSMKKYFKKDGFKFAIANGIMNLSINSFIKESEEGKIMVAKIDSLLKSEKKEITVEFNSKKHEGLETDEVDETFNLNSYSTDKASPVTVYFSFISHNLMRIDVIKYEEVISINDYYKKHSASLENQQFKILLYFNDEGVLKGAEYQKP